MKNEMRKKAIKLRRQGYSYNLIRKKVHVSKSTLSLWLRDIDFVPNKKVINRVKKTKDNLVDWSRERKRKSIEKAKVKAINKVGNLSQRDLLFLGLGLYIGEGAKTQNHVKIINSNPRVISLAIRWFEEAFNLSTENFSITIHLYPDNNIEKALNFWSNVTGIPRKQFCKEQIDKRKKKRGTRGKLKYGTAHLRVKSNGKKEFGVLLFRTIMSMSDEIFKQTD